MYLILVFYNEENKKMVYVKSIYINILWFFFFKLLFFNLLKLMEEIKKFKINKILGKYIGRVIYFLIGWWMNLFLWEKEEMEERKR